MTASRRSREMKIREFLAAYPFGKRNISEEEIELLNTALTHDSYANEEATRNNGTASYERLEFLGDAVMELIVCEHIYNSGEMNEGKMTETKNNIVSNRNMSVCVLKAGIDIDSSLRVGEGHKDKRTGNNVIEENMRADAFEAVLGAVYILYGMEEAKRIVREVFLT